MKPYLVRVIGTPLGDASKFARLALTDEGKSFKRFEISIHDAIAAGFPEDVDELRLDMPDADMFAQEYECRFMASSSRLISESAYDACLYERAGRPGRGGGQLPVTRASTSHAR